jgi:hypothetical protein
VAGCPGDTETCRQVDDARHPRPRGQFPGLDHASQDAREPSLSSRAVFWSPRWPRGTLSDTSRQSRRVSAVSLYPVASGLQIGLQRRSAVRPLPLTTSFGLASSALTSANAEPALSCPHPSSDHDCPCVTVVGHSLSHADRTRCLGASGSRPLRAEPAVVLVPTRRPSVFRPDISPSRRAPCERVAVSPVAVACRWLLLLLSRLLSAQALHDGYLFPLETARG